MVLFTLYQGGAAVKNLAQFELDAYPEHAITMGVDGRLYQLGFSPDEMVL